ncbi:unnamed protein product [Didymodactylos carnosus]|uniref:Uncharacterized protein n=1 Tax=Didymodactylos carnosus TaxID=1234261 RepID=A0A8S2PKT6_9BILA|nr:unnamed protein product [Didymodactylos carnosus]CAF4060004.1 unnamed protein product [Didymodactylos carnosus]
MSSVGTTDIDYLTALFDPSRSYENIIKQFNSGILYYYNDPTEFIQSINMNKNKQLTAFIPSECATQLVPKLNELVQIDSIYIDNNDNIKDLAKKYTKVRLFNKNVLGSQLILVQIKNLTNQGDAYKQSNDNSLANLYYNEATELCKGLS